VVTFAVTVDLVPFLKNALWKKRPLRTENINKSLFVREPNYISLVCSLGGNEVELIIIPDDCSKRKRNVKTMHTTLKTSASTNRSIGRFWSDCSNEEVLYRI